MMELTLEKTSSALNNAVISVLTEEAHNIPEQINIQIDYSFKYLIPPLTDAEYKGLEENILADGIRDPIVLWNNTIVDGHNRYEIARKYGLPFETVQKEFDSAKDAEQWIILNQFGRRNLSAYDRSVLALKLKPIVAEKAKENILATQNNSNSTVHQKSDKQITTSKELAKIAGVSHDTIHKVERIEKEASPEVKKMVRDGEISINKAFLTTTGKKEKSPTQTKKEFYEKIDQEREEFQNKETVTFEEIKNDKKNRGLLARNLYSRCLRMGTGISEVTILEKETNITIEEMVKEMTSSEVDSLRKSIRWWINVLSQIERRM